MPSQWPWNLPSRSGMEYTKQLEGVRVTPELKKLLNECRRNTRDPAVAADESTAVVAATGMSLEQARQVLNNMETTTTTTNDDNAVENKKEEMIEDCPPVLHLSVVQAMTTVLLSRNESTDRLNDALSSSLVFTPPPPELPPTAQQAKWEKRMKRLRLRAEETKYKKLTNNLDNTPEDDVTTKSMMYATSVGLNMIVAPITFGVFMYFFAGQIFSWMVDEEAQYERTALDQQKTDIQKVIAGVVGGVLMLFVEMILFVIRTHAMDESILKKRKTKKLSPFGYTKPSQPTPMASQPTSLVTTSSSTTTATALKTTKTKVETTTKSISDKKQD